MIQLTQTLKTNNDMGFKKLIIGEKMPDKNDPQYRERYEKDVDAGRKFAKALKLDKGVCCIQRFASTNRNYFLAIVFTFVIISVGFNIYRMTKAYSTFYNRGTAVQSLEQAMPEKYHRGNTLELTPYRSYQRQ